MSDQSLSREHSPPEPADTEIEPRQPPRESIPPAKRGLWWRVSGVVVTLRPHQWVKNVFVLAPVVFAKEIFDPPLLGRAAAAFFAFCLLASAVYTINDIADVEADRAHPIKRRRPIASGRVPLPFAWGLATVLVLTALTWAWSRQREFFFVATLYFTINVAYSIRLKHIAYVDVGCIAAGFVLRVMGGGYATYVYVSNYLLICTALLALFLGFGKRRHELAAAATRARLQRAALESYTKRGLDIALGTTALLTVVTYVSYTVDPQTRAFFKSDELWISTVFVLLGLARFLKLVTTRPRAESPTQEILRDGPFVAIVLGWVILVMWVVYKLRPAG